MTSSRPADDPYVGMTAEDAARARLFITEQRTILAKRQAAARLLLAPPGPAAAVQVAWAPLRQALEARKAQAATGAQDNAGKGGGGKA